MLRRSSLLKKVVPVAAIAAMLGWAGAANASLIVDANGNAILGITKKIAFFDDPPVGPGGPNPGLFVTNIFARFNDADDVLTGIGGAFMFSKNGSNFHQDTNFGTDTAPLESIILFGIPPFVPPLASLAFDSFVTIGLKVDDGTDDTNTGLDWAIAGFQGGNSAIGDWSDGNPANPQGLSGLYPQGDGTFWVLIAQLVVDATLPGAGVVGDVIIFWKETAAGGSLNNPGSFDNQIPSPGALALLGLAGLVGARRRRRR